MENQENKWIVKTKYYSFSEIADNFLECGKSLKNITVAYETYGELNKEKTNAVLVLHALSGDAHAAGFHTETDKKPGWWNDMIGPGKCFDTNKYFIISSNVIGGCKGSTGPSSVNPETNQPYALEFPIVTVTDMVKVQKKLTGHLGITKLLAVVGGSMGGMQALEWACLYPENVKTCIVIASCAKLSTQAIAFNAVGRNAIKMDNNWLEGNYYGKTIPKQGLGVARMIGHITYLSDESMQLKFGRRLKDKEAFSYDFETEFQVESYLEYQGEKFVERFDANSYLYITKAMDYFDISEKYGGGSLTNSFKNVLSKFLVISFTTDWLFPTYQSKEIVKALMNNDKDVSFCEIESKYGHDAFLLEFEQQTKIISAFLNYSNKEK